MIIIYVHIYKQHSQDSMKGHRVSTHSSSVFHVVAIGEVCRK